jgi:DNA polymerase-3 subunit delta'
MPEQYVVSHPELLAMAQQRRLPQAVLLVGPQALNLLSFANELTRCLLCEHTTSPPCGDCRACHLLQQQGHPDVCFIFKEDTARAIKIDQVRVLQEDVYQTPQCAAYRIIIIAPVDRMNISASNAFLKVLEEPPSHTRFILVAEQVGSIPATVLSRCQRYTFSMPVDREKAEVEGALSVGADYMVDSPRAILYQQRTIFIEQLCNVIKGQVSPPRVVAQWMAYAFEDLLWLLYLISAAAIELNLQCLKAPGAKSVPLVQLSQLCHPVMLFKQIDQLNAMIKKTTHQINLNETLALEDWLLGFVGGF